MTIDHRDAEGSAGPRRVLLHDFAGHPFQAELSRHLAATGSTVCHAFCQSVATGRGDLALRRDDPVHLTFQGLGRSEFERYHPIGRMRSEVSYGRELAALARRFRPDVVISANTPLLAQAALWSVADRVGSSKIYWIQDFLGRGTRAVLSERSSVLGATMGAGLVRLERHLLRRSDALVPISGDFLGELHQDDPRWPRATVLENWAPLDEVQPTAKANEWSRAHGLDSAPVVVYSGTLGLKHDPVNLVAAADAVAPLGATVVVVTEGKGRDWLEAERVTRQIDNLVMFDYVDYDVLPAVLGTADVCLVLLEASAGTFSVPSKVLTYLAAGKPVVAAMPPANLGAKTIERAGAGVVVPTGDPDAFGRATAALLADEDRRRACGQGARAYAEATFAIGRIGATMRQVIEETAARR